MRNFPVVPLEALRIELAEYPSISAPPRTHIIVTGPSGSGKSAFCLLLAGVLDEPEREAKVNIFNNPLDQMHADDRARCIALVPSDPFLAFTGLKRTLLGELEMIQRLLKTVGKESEAFLKHVAHRLDLTDHLHRDPFTLSGGEAVRAALAMALVKRPLLLVLDQVNEQLDPSAVPRLQQRVAELLTETSVVVETRSRRTSSCVRLGAVAQSANLGSRWSVEMRSMEATSAALADDQASSELMRPTGLPATTITRASLRIEGLKHHYSSSGFNLGPIDLSVGLGERVALIGPNGSGKSTFLKCLALLERPTFKRLEITAADGNVVTPPPERQVHLWAARALYCFQRPDDQLYLSTVREELAETARRLGTAEAYDTALNIAEQFGLAPYLDMSPFDLPRSFRRLIPLAGALSVDPPLLLLDEPTVGLDDAQVAQLTKLIVERRQNGATIFISHDQVFIETAATHCIDIQEIYFHHGQPSKPAWRPA